MKYSGPIMVWGWVSVHSNVSNQKHSTSNTIIRLGCYPRIGFDFAHFNINVDFNLIVHSIQMQRFNNSSLIRVQPDGKYYIYDKRLLIRMTNEDAHYSPGVESMVVEWKGWKIKPFICYDLRFPVWCRNKSENEAFEYDLVFFVANWPAVRVNAWDILLQARAIENLAYCVGVNRVGEDGNGIAHNGHSGIYNPKGEALYFANDREEIKTTLLSKEELVNFRAKFPAHLDADSFKIGKKV